MTLRTNARLAGSIFLLYIATGIADMALFGRVSSGVGVAAKLANIAQHETLVRLSAGLSLAMSFYALVVAMTVYALTRDYDRDLALLAMLCRVIEGANNSMGATATLRLLSVAKTAAVAAPADAAAANALGSMLLSGTGLGSATLFALGSTIYCYIFLRARTIPVPLAWLGVFASVLLVIALPLQMLRVIEPNWFIWMPCLVFEVTLAFWLLIKGVAPQPAPQSSNA